MTYHHANSNSTQQMVEMQRERHRDCDMDQLAVVQILLAVAAVGMAAVVLQLVAVVVLRGATRRPIQSRLPANSAVASLVVAPASTVEIRRPSLVGFAIVAMVRAVTVAASAEAARRNSFHHSTIDITRTEATTDRRGGRATV